MLGVVCCCHIVQEAVFRIQGPYLNIESCLKMQTNGQQSSKNEVKNKYDFHHCHDDERAVFRVQSPSLKIEQSQKIVLNSYKIHKEEGKIRIIFAVVIMSEKLCSGSISKYRKSKKKSQRKQLENEKERMKHIDSISW